MATDTGSDATTQPDAGAPADDLDEGFITPPTGHDAPDAPSAEVAEPPADGEDDVDFLKEDLETEADTPEEDGGDGLVDIELEDGETIRADPRLKAGYERTKDYHSKTQDLARQREQVTLQAEQMARTKSELAAQRAVVEVHQETLAQRVQIGLLDLQIAKLDSLDWTKLNVKAELARERGDDDVAQEIEDTFKHREAIKAERLKLADELETKEGELKVKQDEAETVTRTNLAQAIVKGEEVLRKEIGWNDDMGKEIIQFGMNRFGFSLDEGVQAIADPRMIKCLALAYKGEQALRRERAAKQAGRMKAGAPARVAGARAEAAAPVGTDDPRSDKMGTDEWMEKENARLAKERQQRTPRGPGGRFTS